jgi:hypothetical protein
MVHIIKEEYRKRKGRDDAVEIVVAGSADDSRFAEGLKLSLSWSAGSDNMRGDSCCVSGCDEYEEYARVIHGAQ